MKHSVAIVGTGALGTALAAALRGSGHVVSAWSRSGAAEGDGPEAFARRNTLAELAPSGASCDVLVLCVTDTAIEAVARRCAQEFASVPAVALHTSGCTPVGALDALAERGASTGLFHPLCAVGGPAVSGAHGRFAGAAFGVLGDGEALRVATELARELGGRPLVVEADQQARYHAAATLAAGGTVALAEVARALLCGALVTASNDDGEDASRASDDALFAVRGLVASAAHNLARTTPAAALTGPHVRGDLGTLEAHRRALAADDPAATEARRVAAALAPALLRLVAERLAAGAAGGAVDAANVDLRALARALGLRP
ncbi:Rossmann-like domain protein [Planctomycetes bacterium Pla163]|uniref:Rossmann-like domain protein n=1 Tax=Rohdeia mirabilis TaxID=2528008 RepID=A0A518CZJ3_9BACT|nr:Rossmann-like domain protein [Planctomycetes bacterium Pla163]